MGQAISAVVEEAAKESPEKEKLVLDVLLALQDLGDLQTRTFKREVYEDSDTRKVAVKKIISDERSVRCNVEIGEKSIAEYIKNTYKVFADGDIADSIAVELRERLDDLFSMTFSSSNSNQLTRYFLTLGAAGFPVRVDVCIYTYAFRSETFVKVAKNVLAISMIVSSVDITQLNESALAAAVQYCYGSAPADKQKSILAQFVAAKSQAR